jgi:CRP-like cAMP-binding protein
MKSMVGQEHKPFVYDESDYFGELPLLPGSPALTSVNATEPSRVMQLDASALHDLIMHCRALDAEC